MRVTKWWQKFLLWVNYRFKSTGVSSCATTYKEKKERMLISVEKKGKGYIHLLDTKLDCID